MIIRGIRGKFIGGGSSCDVASSDCRLARWGCDFYHDTGPKAGLSPCERHVGLSLCDCRVGRAPCRFLRCKPYRLASPALLRGEEVEPPLA